MVYLHPLVWLVWFYIESIEHFYIYLIYFLLLWLLAFAAGRGTYTIWKALNFAAITTLSVLFLTVIARDIVILNITIDINLWKWYLQNTYVVVSTIVVITFPIVVFIYYRLLQKQRQILRRTALAAKYASRPPVQREEGDE